MTTQEYQEAYDDDSDQVRSWPAQDAQKPPSDVERDLALEGDELAMWDEIVKLRILCGKAAAHLERVVAQVQADGVEIVRLQNELHGVLCDRAERDATIAVRDAAIARLTIRLAEDDRDAIQAADDRRAL